MKILLVDDEALARGILKNSLQQLGYEQILEACNGAGALDLLKRETPKVVFVDMRMPEMSGIELIEKALAISEQFIFIVLSGYNLFEYAQQAMKLGVYQYLLKPIEDSKLEETMEAVKQKIYMRTIERERLSNLHISANKSQILLRKQYLYELLSGDRSSISHYLELLEENQVILSNAYFKVFLIQLKYKDLFEQATSDLQLILFGVENIIHEILENENRNGHLFYDGKMIGVLLNSPGETDLSTDKTIFETIFFQIKEFVQYFTVAKITMGVGRDIEGMPHIQEAYLSANEAMNQQIIQGGDQIFYARESMIVNKKDTEIKKQIEEAIMKAVARGDLEKLEKFIEELYEPYYRIEAPDIKNLHKIHLHLFVLLHKELEKQGIVSNPILEDEFLLYRQIQSCETIEAMKAFLYEKTVRCMEEIGGKAKTGNQKIMEQAKEFIQENLGYELTLDRVAEQINLSSVYFSTLFKAEEGLTYMDYVTHLKIERAKQLLDRNMKISDICEDIGFQDVKHFYKVFKKAEGITPNQYRKGFL